MKQNRGKRLVWEGLAAAVWCLLTLFTDRLIFEYQWPTLRFFVYKIVFILIAFVLIHSAVTVIRNIRCRDARTLRWLRWTLPYLAISLVVLLIVWPGCWGYDNLWVLGYARTLHEWNWHYFLTSSVFALCLMFLPFPGGVVLIQDLLISGIVGMFLSTAQTLAEQRLKKRVPPVLYLILYIPFLLPPVLMHNQHPFRTTWASWTELTAVFLVVRWYLRGTRVSKKELAIFALLAGVTAAWRSECIYYLVAFPVLLCVVWHKKILRPVQAVGTAAALIVVTLLCNAYNESLEPGTAWKYQRLALCYQAAALVQDADPSEDAEELALIDPIFDVQACRENSNLHGSDLQNAVTRPDSEVTQEDWSNCVKGMLRLAVKYPGSLLRERMGMFLNTVEQQELNSSQKIVFYGTKALYWLEPSQMAEPQSDFLYHMALTWPINLQLRENFIDAMTFDPQFLGGIVASTWLMLPSFVLLFAAVVVLLLCRKWMLFLAAGALFVRIPLVFLTAPDSYFMYYLTPYIAGYAVAAAGIVYAILLTARKKQQKACLPQE